MYLKNLKTDLFQWDTNQILVLDEYPSGTFVHIGNNADRAYTLMSDSNCEVEVPNILLQECKPIVVYVQVESEDGAKYVDKRAVYPVRRRGKPDDYVYTPTEVLNYETLLLSIQTKQGALIAGAGITIDDDNVITADSATSSVLSVNGQTGTVALDADAVGALPAQKSGDVYELTGAIVWDGETLATEEAVAGQYEPFANKVTTISSASTDTQYPSAKCAYDAIATATTSAVAAHNLSASAHSTLFAGRAKYVDLGTDVTTDDIFASNIFDNATDAATIYRGACSLDSYGATAWVFNTPYGDGGTVLCQVMLLGGMAYSRENWGTSWGAWSDGRASLELAVRKVSSITAGNSTSTNLYPSVKATVDYIAAAITGAIGGSY